MTTDQQAIIQRIKQRENDMLTIQSAQARVEATEYNMDVAYYDVCHGHMTEAEYKRICREYEDALLDLAKARGRKSRPCSVRCFDMLTKQEMTDLHGDPFRRGNEIRTCDDELRQMRHIELRQSRQFFKG